MDFNIGDKVKHKGIKGKVGTIIHKVPDSMYYYVRLNCTTYSIPYWSLVLVSQGSVKQSKVVPNAV